jgi:hypothetical protein
MTSLPVALDTPMTLKTAAAAPGGQSVCLLHIGDKMGEHHLQTEAYHDIDRGVEPEWVRADHVPDTPFVYTRLPTASAFHSRFLPFCVELGRLDRVFPKQ